MRDLEERINKCIAQESKRLCLSGFIIGVKGAVYLASRLSEIIYLEYLSLDSNRMGDEGTMALALALALPDAPNIKTLNLRSNQIGNKGAVVLAQALPRTHITLLELSGNYIENEGMIALALALEYTCITTLELNIIDSDDEGVVALASALPRTRIAKLGLGSSKMGNEGAMALALALPNAPHVTHLFLRHCYRIDYDVEMLVQRTLYVNQYNYRRRAWTMQDYCLMAITNTGLVPSVVLINFKQRKKDNRMLFNLW